jgi:hypothetical protein
MEQSSSLDLFLNAETNFSEILPEPVEVDIVEYEETEVGTRPNGKPIIRRDPVARTTYINTYVPMRIFHKMIASQEKIKRAQAMMNGEEKNSDAMISWMTEQVLAVWQLTEPDMDLDTLLEGLTFPKILGLFSVFFGSQLKLMQAQAQQAEE